MRRILPRDVVKSVEEIVDDVTERGLQAALEYSRRFDGVVPERALLEPRPGGDPDVVAAALEVAKSLEMLYSKLKPPEAVDFYGGVLRSVFWRPVRSVALYVPARYVSTLVMLAVPARAAGVEKIYVVTPPKGATGELLAVAKELDVAGVIPIGGPHGLAYAVFHMGVDMVAGPGGLYVQAAKYVLSLHVGIDGIEGPTELVVYAEGVPPEKAVAGALAQLEHGPTSFAYLVSTDSGLLEAAAEIYRRERTSSMGPLEVRKVHDVEEAVRLIDSIAPEHLEVWGAREVAYRVRNVGAVSVNMPSPYLDYAAGISHVLPTGGSARWRGIITPATFMKPIGVAEAVGRLELLEAARRLAEYEGFRYHRQALA
ncbi:histidinol dehydrogenase [Pyrobaculum islandicum DSM 4184]|uniref:Histidinol dehydrogenase n=1 Tax=Pyrobaculum islandicum (strain DSM 4184 / JCM 9189 / GEO3) TaxID=384616 RepID=A1RTV0_PYRIL|nr:histidinol dehydrogenase [Pyrobaculum islandicum]ABL88382.1 histidinol dehydrogenase [Pyrobaculum islandicum DSM 4184]